MMEMTDMNRPFPSSLVPLFQSESKCETILMKMTLICKKMKLHAELIFIHPCHTAAILDMTYIL